eukprot:scaffold2657_cov89-Amphora_coffeaeformis.AAC.39
MRIQRRGGVSLLVFVLTFGQVYVSLHLDSHFSYLLRTTNQYWEGGNSTTSADHWHSERVETSQHHNDPAEADEMVLGVCRPIDDQTGTDILLNATLGIWSEDDPLPEWVHDLCPEVVKHYQRFPLFRDFVTYQGAFLPVSTTVYAAKAACTLSVVQHLAASVGATLHLYAGSHLGAILHGQVIPWDDDVDAILPVSAMPAFRQACSGSGVPIHKTARLVCHNFFNALKVYVEYGDMKEPFIHPRFHRYKAPFVDLFASQIQGNNVAEVKPDGTKKLKNLAWPMEIYYPIQPYYYAGLTVLGPNPELARHRYALDRCVLNGQSHRAKTKITIAQVLSNNLELDCCRLSRMLPFVHTTKGGGWSIQNRQSAVHYPIPNFTVLHERLAALHTSIAQREEWRSIPPECGQNLTDALSHLMNHVDVDNTIASDTETKACQNKSTLKIVEFNANRGTFWLEASGLLRQANADVIILNEMDIGMARSGQQHTARFLAQHLQMNYAWGLEFIELTNGNGEEQAATKDLNNFHGLHGNAILTKCVISDPAIFRDPIGKYFSNQRIPLNAYGTEKRLGGRMGLFVRLRIGDTNETIVVGSTHKVAGIATQVRQYIGTSRAVTAGDQHRRFCKMFGLSSVDNATHYTWPASCTDFGKGRGDNICSNLPVVEAEVTLHPCVEKFGISAKLSDHAPTMVTLGL